MWKEVEADEASLAASWGLQAGDRIYIYTLHRQMSQKFCTLTSLYAVCAQANFDNQIWRNPGSSQHNSDPPVNIQETLQYESPSKSSYHCCNVYPWTGRRSCNFCPIAITGRPPHEVVARCVAPCTHEMAHTSGMLQARDDRRGEDDGSNA